MRREADWYSMANVYYIKIDWSRKKTLVFFNKLQITNSLIFLTSFSVVVILVYSIRSFSLLSRLLLLLSRSLASCTCSRALSPSFSPLSCSFTILLWAPPPLRVSMTSSPLSQSLFPSFPRFHIASQSITIITNIYIVKWQRDSHEITNIPKNTCSLSQTKTIKKCIAIKEGTTNLILKKRNLFRAFSSASECECDAILWVVCSLMSSDHVSMKNERCNKLVNSFTFQSHTQTGWRRKLHTTKLKFIHTVD